MVDARPALEYVPIDIGFSEARGRQPPGAGEECSLVLAKQSDREGTLLEGSDLKLHRAIGALPPAGFVPFPCSFSPKAVPSAWARYGSGREFPEEVKNKLALRPSQRGDCVDASGPHRGSLARLPIQARPATSQLRHRSHRPRSRCGCCAIQDQSPQSSPREAGRIRVVRPDALTRESRGHRLFEGTVRRGPADSAANLRLSSGCRRALGRGMALTQMGNRRGTTASE